MEIDPKGMKVTVFLEIGDPIERFALSPDETVVAVYTHPSHLRFYSIESLKEAREYSEAVSPFQLAWSPDGSSLALAGIGLAAVLSALDDSDSFPVLVFITAMSVVVVIALLTYAKTKGSREESRK